MSGPRTKPGDPPTRRQYEIFRLIVRHLAEHAVPPAIQELTALAGVRGTFGLYTQVHALAAKGLITLGPRGKFRAIQVPAVAARSPRNNPMQFPAWAPQDTAIAYVTSDSGRSIIEMVDTRTSKVRQVVMFPRGRNADISQWSADGRYIAFQYGSGGGSATVPGSSGGSATS